MSDRVDCAIIGAGVVGLAIGRLLAQTGREVLVIERNPGIGEETSSRNSEVIHAGLYYPTASLKALLCVSGRSMLYDYCERKQIPHRRCGKLIVATGRSQFARLDQIAEQARRNGVEDLVIIDQAKLSSREPEVRGTAALWSPSTGIVDSHALMLALAGDLEAADGVIATQTSVEAIDVAPDSIRLQVRSGDDQSELIAATVINSAGLQAGRLAAQCTGLDDYVSPPIHLAKGNYFTYSGASPFQTLIYPLPVDGGLGIHATLDLGGRLRFGPDVEWIEDIDYRVDPGRSAVFAESIQTYWPGLHAAKLVPGYSGIRPKLSGPGEAVQDFRIDVAAAGQSRQLVHLLGIESPGLTSVLALAKAVGERLNAAAA
jgi:L-2-hydroxyglutarate oxidase LhgO